jgi:uncharacterized protein YfaS (alpha-2-macroglobulin family)
MSMSARSWICFLQWILSGVLCLLGLLALSSCGGRQATAVQDEARQAAWSSLISGHTTGVVSRKSAVRIRFATDVAPTDGSRPDLRKAVMIEPAVDAAIAFDGSRELVLEPKKDLEPGGTYLVRVLPGSLPGVPSDLPPYEFRFRVQAPDIEVAVRGLESAQGDVMRLRGTVTSADIENSVRIEQVVSVSFLGKDLPLQWAHAGLKHDFVASDVRRQREAQSLLVKWSGKPIASSSSGQQAVEVPARGRFLVTQEQVVEDEGRRQVVVYFSNNLDPRQDLKGLVHLKQGNLTAHIQGNTLVVYPEDDPQGDLTLILEAGIRDDRGDRLEDSVVQTHTFGRLKPQVRFVGRGVILPDGDRLTIPFEAVGARSVSVTALRIYDDNVGQFLQINRLDGNLEMGRVGRFLWRRTVSLTTPAVSHWSRYDLDVTDLMRKNPGGMFQLTLQLTPDDSSYECATGEADTPAGAGKRGAHLSRRVLKTSSPVNQEDGEQAQQSNWDYTEEYFDANGATWARRADPCDAAYFVYGENVHAQRNLLASNIGLLAKRDQQGRLLVTATDLRLGRPRPGVKIAVRNFQNRILASASTDANGMATLTPAGTPFLLVGESSGQRSYLKLNPGNALPTSHFDVGGESVAQGVKGFLYGDRGVWRPGDTLYLTFVLQDKSGTLPAGHPVTLELYDPRGRLVQSDSNASPVGGFYRFDLKTAPDAPTGDWTAKALLGELTFTQHLRVETVMPNRLKVSLDLAPFEADRPLHGSVSAQWLSGATAAQLKTDVRLALAPVATRFGRFADYVFDDPARQFATKSESVFEGALDANGAATFDRSFELGGSPPGMLSATFTTRVFERGGAFSINRETVTYAPYARFVGVRLPKGDAARDMLLTDQEHTVEIATLSSAGEPVSVSQLRVTLYKVEWKWWWDKTGDSLAQYAQGNGNTVVSEDTVATVNGAGQWKFEIKYPQWGRYLLRVCDAEHGHCAGRTFYIDWPSWAGKQREQSGPAANVLAITSDKPKYVVGDTATVQLPESAQGRALVTIENGTEVVEARWIEPRAGNTRFTVPITAAMAPNVYVAVTLIQPHEEKESDRPIRLYGVIPLEIADPQTRLSPVLHAADEWKPESRGEVQVSEAQGRAMTYTLAVVDEGLLSLTNFKTPDLYEYFYRREALGVTTWDLYDDVVGAYGTELERLLALGGSDAAPQTNPDEAHSRFPPVVRFLGPFRLEAGATATHQIDLPRYLGAVRVMVVAGEKRAYGSAEKSVFVRQPLMLLPTMPRVIGPGEEVAVPVSVFVSDPDIRDVTLTLEPDAMFSPIGETTTRIRFSRPQEQLGMLRLKATDRIGKGHVRVTARAGEHHAESEIYIDVRSSNPPTTLAVSRVLKPGETWETKVVPHGLDGTNTATLEVSSMPALDLESRLQYLIQYPHGCLEQTTSSVFPQLYLSSLLELEPQRKEQIEDNIRNGIERLRWFQLSNGGFSYWPGASGGFASGSLEGYELWATTYASHFLIEAERAGYTLPPTMRSNFVRNLKLTAQQWTPGALHGSGSTLDQAYRLYVLALAGQPEVGAMNRLREFPQLASTERWILAATYKLAGLGDLADSLVAGKPLDADARRSADFDYTFGSQLRDRAMVLQSLITLGHVDRSEDLVRAIAAELASQHWYSTQSVAYSLMAMARLAGTGTTGVAFTLDHDFGGKATSVVSHAPVYQARIGALPLAGQAVSIRNTSPNTLFATIATRGVPEAGADDSASSGLALQVRYSDDSGKPIEVDHLAQGVDLIAHVEVRNLSAVRIDNIALTHIFPAGWEIHNDRLDNASAAGARDESPPARNPWLIPDGSREATQATADYTDIRDDRVLQYFGLRPGETIRFDTRLNAAYRGRYYLPSVQAEAMYDATKSARTRGQWTEVAGAAH